MSVHTFLKRADAAASPICAPPRASVYTKDATLRREGKALTWRLVLCSLGSCNAEGLSKRTLFESIVARLAGAIYLVCLICNIRHPEESRQGKAALQVFISVL